jgi:DNA-binding transcriptional LysR family regulator
VNLTPFLQHLARHGQGIALLADALVAEDVAEGRLERVLPRWQAPPVSVYAITETRLLPAKTQRFIEFLRERLAAL